jgi:hypothetical protein
MMVTFYIICSLSVKWFECTWGRLIFRVSNPQMVPPIMIKGCWEGGLPLVWLVYIRNKVLAVVIFLLNVRAPRRVSASGAPWGRVLSVA